MSMTTIAISESLKQDLDTIKKVESESYEAVLQRVINHYNENGDSELDEKQVRKIARQTVNDMVLARALE